MLRAVGAIGAASLISACDRRDAAAPEPDPTPQARVTVDARTGADVVLPAGLLRIDPADRRLVFCGFADVERRTTTLFRGERSDDENGYGAINPCARLRFATDAQTIVFDVLLSGRVGVEDVNDSSGFLDPFYVDVLVDGRGAGGLKANTKVDAPIAYAIVLTGLASAMKTVELVWPYERAMDLAGVRLSRGAAVRAVAAPLRRLVCGGDSITMGFAADRPADTWTYAVAQACGLDLVNMGYSNRTSMKGDGERDGALSGAIGTYLIGYNNYDRSQTEGETLQSFSADITDYIEGWFGANPVRDARLLLLTPIWSENVAPKPVNTLDDYRGAIAASCRMYLDAHPDARLTMVDGLTLMTNSKDRTVDGIHPNTAGAAEIADALSRIIRPLVGTAQG